MGLCSPNAPEQRVRETVWMYSQGAPMVFAGDVHYYAIEHDLRDTAKNIDTSICMLYVLSGEYDWSAYPAASKALADAVPGATYTLMEGMGTSPCQRIQKNSKNILCRYWTISSQKLELFEGLYSESDMESKDNNCVHLFMENNK